MKNKGKSITFRLSNELYEKCVERSLKIGNEEKRIVNISEIIREILKKEFNLWKN